MNHPPLHTPTSLWGANGRRMIVVLMTVAAAVLLAVPATASADVSKEHAKAYKAQLGEFSTYMRQQKAMFDSRSEVATSFVTMTQNALPNPDLLAAAKKMCLDMRADWEDLVQADSRDAAKEITSFRARALTWFPRKTAKADKKRFLAALSKTEAGFTDMFDAERELNSALSSLGLGADVASANNRIQAAKITVIGASGMFDDGMNGLRALQ
jgi:hypothetical protein